MSGKGRSIIQMQNCRLGALFQVDSIKFIFMSILTNKVLLKNYNLCISDHSSYAKWRILHESSIFSKYIKRVGEK